jgi:hypothetical protein
MPAIITDPDPAAPAVSLNGFVIVLFPLFAQIH